MNAVTLPVGATLKRAPSSAPQDLRLPPGAVLKPRASDIAAAEPTPKPQVTQTAPAPEVKLPTGASRLRAVGAAPLGAEASAVPSISYGVAPFARGFNRLQQVGALTIRSLGLSSDQETAQSLARDEADIANYPSSPNVQRGMEEIGNAKGFGEAASAIARNPGAVVDTAAESLVTSAAPLVSGLVGAIAGAIGGSVVPGIGTAAGGGAGLAAGVGIGSFATEYASTVSDTMRDHGVDLTNEESVKAAFSDPALMSEARTRGLKRGIPIAIFDGLSGGIAGRLAGPVARSIEGIGGNVASRVAGGTAEMTAQAGLGAAGEASGQVVDKGSITNPADVLMEGAAEIIPGLGEAGIGRLTREAPAPVAGADELPPGAVPAEQLLPTPREDVPSTAGQPMETPDSAIASMYDTGPGQALFGAPPTRADLEAVLNDTRPLEAIKAEREATANWAPTAEWQAVPPGAVPTPELETREVEGITQARIAPEPGTRAAPVIVTAPEDVNLGAERTAEPTPAQAEAGNYAKRHLKWNGLDIAIETEAGQQRTGVAPDGKPWSVTMPADYGYFKRSEGADDEPIDVYLGHEPHAHDAFIVDQVDAKTGDFDEHKIILGVPDEASARELYDAGFSDGKGPERMGALTRVTIPELKEWIASGDTKAPVGAVAQAEDGAQVASPFDQVEAKPRIYPKDNFGAPLAKHAPIMFRETSANRALEMLPHGNVVTDLGPAEIYLADTPDMALGQSANQGVKLAFDTADLRGQINTSKPTAKLSYEQGLGEFVARLNKQSTYQRAVRAVRIDKSVKLDSLTRARLMRTLKALEADGWKKVDTPEFTDWVSPQVRRGKASLQEAEVRKSGANAEYLKRVAAANGLKLFPEEIEEAARLVDAGADTLDALGEAVERAALEGQAELVETAREEGLGDEWTVPFDGEETQGTGDRPAPESHVSAEPQPGAEAGRAPPRLESGQNQEVTVEINQTGQQAVIPGAERISDKELAERRMDAPKRAAAEQKPADEGLFDAGSRNQTEMFSVRNVAPRGVRNKSDGALKVTPGAATITTRPRSASPEIEMRTPFSGKFLDKAEALYPSMRKEMDRLGLGSVGLKLADTIETWVNGNLGAADGAFYRNIITVSLSSKRMKEVLNHEALHALRRLGLFTDGEWAILTRASEEKWRKQYNISKAYGAFPEWAQIEEGIAHAYGEWAAGRGKIHGRIVRLFKRIADFMEALRSTLKGQGFTTAEQIFEKIESGEVGARASEMQTDGDDPKFAANLPDTAEGRKDAMQGFIGRGQPIDRLLRIPFDIFGGIDAQGRWKPGLRLFNGASKIITEAKFSPAGRFAFANPILETARRGLVDRYGLSEEYVARDRDRALDERKVMMQGTEILKTLKDHAVGPEEAKVLQAILTGEAVAGDDMAKLAQPIREAIDTLGQEAVELGLLSAESFERNRGSYLHRVYKKHEVDQDGLTKMISGMMGRRRKKIIGDQFKGRGMFLDLSLERLMKDVPGWAAGEKGKPQNGDKFRVLDEYPDQIELDVGPSKKPSPIRRVYLPEGTVVPEKYADFRDEGIWEVRGEKGKNLVLWGDFTKPERESMGEILDARYTIGKTFALMAHDLATGRFYQDIAKNAAWAQSDVPNEGWIDAAEWAKSGQRFVKKDGIEWVKVPGVSIPDSGGKLRWGALSEKYVREEIWRDLNELDVLHRPNVWRTLLTQWKLNKTARSPVVHMNNVMSNFVFMDMADVRMQDLVAGIRAFVEGEKSADYQEALANGAFGADAMTQEVTRNVLKPILDELETSAAAQSGAPVSKIDALGKLALKLFGYAKWADEKMIDAYRVEDEIFRMASYMRRRSLGDTPKQAADFARQQFIDYDIRAPWVNLARNSVLPFISYTYRAAPLVARAIAQHPWKLAKYALIAQAVNSLGYILTGDDDEDRERRSLREEEQGSTWIGAPRMLRMPLNDRYGNPVFLDIRRWIPAGDLFDTQGNDIPAWLNLSGPLLLGSELFLNRSSFTGDDIVNTEVDDFWERGAGRADYLWKAWMPSAAWVPGSWYWQKISNAIKGATDSSGRPYGLGLAAASSVGIKLKPQDVEDAMSWKAYEFSKTERALKEEARRATKQHKRGILSDRAFNQRMQTLMEKQERLSEKAKETLR